MLRTEPATGVFGLACPACRLALEETRCPACGVSYLCEGGIWRFLTAEAAARYERFERDYLTVRRDEGWGSPDSRYYQALPFDDLSGRFSQLWRIRAASFRALLREIDTDRHRRVLDLGAGNCWLSNQLARRGHQVAAIDLLIDDHDGLGAARHYEIPLTLIQAEFDRLPLHGAQTDLAIFNGSLHYSTDIEHTLREALRVLDDRGTIAILDSPMYPTVASGRQMVQEREARFERTYGFASDTLASEHFLTPQRLLQLGQALNVRWRILKPWHGWHRAVLPLLARVRGTRAPALFPVVIGSRA